jgi:hypothetical protein
MFINLIYILQKKNRCEGESVNAEYRRSRCLLADSREQRKQGVWAKRRLFSVNAEDNGS